MRLSHPPHLTVFPKVLRVFVESVLRYGLPVNNCTMVVQPLKGKLKQARRVLAQLFAHLDSASGRDAAGLAVAVVGAA
ncbi:MAG: hypothetical protein B7Y31_14710 [Novosphingobium sp. 16-62-11]|nr:MAG: hypothetical protein B7Y31_14710 [Novosphingobium sp. 16-62-11]